MTVPDVIVVGGGPAGLACAISAARHGARVVVLDEQLAPGGQLFKQIHKFFGSRGHLAGVRGLEIGRRLLHEASSLGVDIRLDATVYGVYPGPEVAVVTGGRARRLKAKRLVIATGASENAVAFPGWTLPGVMGAGAAQTMVNVHRVLPGRHVLMVGSGNVGLIVAYQLLQAGAEVAAVVEALPRVGGYQVHAAKLRRAGVQFLLGSTVVAAHGDGQVEVATVASLGEDGQPVPGTERSLAVDTICLAVGLNPAIELPLVMGCRTAYVGELGGHVPLHDADMRATLEDVYVAGDVTGVEEASTAMEEGSLAGLAVAESLGLLGPEQAGRQKAEVRARLEALRAGPFGAPRRAAKARIVAALDPAAAAPVARADTQPATGLKPACGDRQRRGPVAVIECPEEIPCDPCVAACPRQAISLGPSLTDLPVLDAEACTGCGLCITACPGMAIFMVDERAQETLVSFPHEYLPLPEAGAVVQVVDADGRWLGEGRVVSVRTPAAADLTSVVTVSATPEYGRRVRGMLRAGA